MDISDEGGESGDGCSRVGLEGRFWYWEYVGKDDMSGEISVPVSPFWIMGWGAEPIPSLEPEAVDALVWLAVVGVLWWCSVSERDFQ